MSGRIHRALLIGNGEFPKDPQNLLSLGDTPANDLKLLRSALTDPHIGLFDTRDLELLPENGLQETRIAVDRFFSRASVGDVLLLYYSGHGLLDIRDNLYLCARDTTSAQRRVTALDTREVSEAIEQSAASTVIIVLDCCYSGAFKRSGLPTDHLQGTGRYVLSSCREAELSMTGDECSVFTAALVKGLYEASPDRYLRLTDLYEFVHTELVAGDSGQVPKRDFDGEGDVVIAKRILKRARVSDRAPDVDMLEPADHFRVDPRLRRNGRGRLIDQIADRYVEDLLARSPMMATYMGVPGSDHLLDDLSPEGKAAETDLARRTIAELEVTEPIDELERVAKDGMLERLRLSVERHDAGDDFLSLNVLASSVHEVRQIFDLMPHDGEEAVVNIAKRLNAVPTAFGQFTEALRAEAAAGRVAAKRQVLEVAKHCDNWNGANGDDFWGGLLGRVAINGEQVKVGPLMIDLANGVALARAATAKFARFLREELLPQASEKDAVGCDRYSRASRYFIGADIDLEATYAWAWKELARIKADMSTTAARISPGDTIAQTIRKLDRDPAQNIVGREAFREWVQGVANEALADLADAHFDIPEQLRRVECMIAPVDDGAVYYTGPSEDLRRPGRIWWSMPSDPSSYTKWREKSQIYLLGAPGHHLQIGQTVARAELLNRFQRQMLFCTGHASGWARYCERLVEELGFYDRDPAGKLGMLDNHAFNTARVIVDIGLHCEFRIPKDNPIGWRPGERWDPQTMFEFVRAHTYTVDNDMLRFEIHRYLGWPGQAPSYKIGERLWMRLREECAARKGGDFSLKQFHTHTLKLGPMGMGPLAEALRRF